MGGRGGGRERRWAGEEVDGRGHSPMSHPLYLTPFLALLPHPPSSPSFLALTMPLYTQGNIICAAGIIMAIAFGALLLGSAALNQISFLLVIGQHTPSDRLLSHLLLASPLVRTPPHACPALHVASPH